MNKHFDDNSYWMSPEQRRRQSKRKRRKRVLIWTLCNIGLAAVAITVIFFFVLGRGKKPEKPGGANQPAKAEQEASQAPLADGQTDGQAGTVSDGEANNTQEEPGSTQGAQEEENENYETTQDTKRLGKKITSKYVILADIDNGTIVARKNETKRIVPASMTKVLTLLVAVEQIENSNTKNFDEKFKITDDIIDYCYTNECSSAGFEKKEKVTVKDLLYGTVLPSGADAALGLAEYVAGSQDAFVELMNEKLDELGLSETAHFTNCVGIYNEDHYCTVSDMAVMMEAAVANDMCQEILSARTYNTSKTKQHPKGILLSNWFLRRIEDKDAGGEVLCGKTGYVAQSGNCAVSYGKGKNGENYICVTANTVSGWSCIYDHVKLYKRFFSKP